MKITLLFPIVLCVIDFGACLVYLCAGDKARALYWISACSITASTLWIK